MQCKWTTIYKMMFVRLFNKNNNCYFTEQAYEWDFHCSLQDMGCFYFYFIYLFVTNFVFIGDKRSIFQLCIWFFSKKDKKVRHNRVHITAEMWAVTRTAPPSVDVCDFCKLNVGKQKNIFQVTGNFTSIKYKYLCILFCALIIRYIRNIILLGPLVADGLHNTDSWFWTGDFLIQKHLFRTILSYKHI